MTARGGYFDGKSSLRREVVISLLKNFLVLNGEGVDLRIPVGEVRVTPPIGSVRRSLRFPDGAICEVDETEILDQLEDLTGKGKAVRLLHRWEKSLTRAFVTLLVMAAVIWGFMKYGIPWLATRVAFAIPPATEKVLGRQTLAALDKVLFTPSRLPADRKKTLASRFSATAASFPTIGATRLEFRSGEKIGPNALALPSGIVVLTDELVKIAKNDDEIVAVLAHELGHVERRHTMRHILQSSAAGLVMVALTGDILSVTSLSATLPTALVEAKFSRDFEREADDAAALYLQTHGIPLRRFSDILQRLQAEHDRKRSKRKQKDDETFTDYLSTHPPTSERIERFMGKDWRKQKNM
jgi:Zn-dependent protease with chaperone function